MKVVDARSGAELSVGQRLDYPPLQNGDEDWIKLVEVKEGIFTADVRVLLPVLKGPRMDGRPATGMVTRRLRIRWLHPAFPFQRVVFLPS